MLKISAPLEITTLDPCKAAYIFTRSEIAESVVAVDNEEALVTLVARGTGGRDLTRCNGLEAMIHIF